MNKIIWKDIDSTTIKGLIISELPPITKPRMRVQETQVDGVDGSIIEELGYETYDKSMRIGLSYNYDIDEVIKYFSGEGQVVFSNEPNKYYNARIIEQIDYERLLRFKEATVTFRVQPFKYEYQEEEQIASTGSIEGTNIQITDSKITELTVEGKSEQGSTIEWNGDTTGKEVLQFNNEILGNYTLYKVSDQILNKEDLVGKTYNVCGSDGSDEIVEIEESHYDDMFMNGQSIVLYGGYIPAIIVVNETTEETPYSTGTYFLKIEAGEGDYVYVSKLNDKILPTPDTPIEIESIGYKNLFNKDSETTNIYIGEDGSEITATGDSFIKQELIPTSDKYIMSYKESHDNAYVRLAYYNGDTFISREISIENGYVFSVPSECTRIDIRVDTGEEYFEDLQIEEGEIAHSYVSYGKYGIEVKSTGNNVAEFDETYKTEFYYTYKEFSHNNISVTKKTEGGVFFAQYYIHIKEAGTYKFSCEVNFDAKAQVLYFYKDKLWGKSAGVRTISTQGKYEGEFTFDEARTYVVGFYGDKEIGNTYQVKNFMIRPASVESKKYQPYQSNVVLTLTDPLRSLPNGVKDIAYIKKNRLYVDRHVGVITYNGSDEETYTLNESFDSGYSRFSIQIKEYKPNASDINTMCNCLTIGRYENTWDVGQNSLMLHTDATFRFILSDELTSGTINGLKTWLSENNVQVIYELATPVTEDYGNLAILNLMDGENNISNSADTNMVIEYIETLNINNLGNYISKPIFEIEGEGKIEFILNGYTLFSYNFNNDRKVVIDSEKQDAYLGTVLKNRNMSGEFPVLEIGENTVTWNGIIKNIKAVKKSRWL